jgi:hypothetical protein
MHAMKLAAAVFTAALLAGPAAAAAPAAQHTTAGTAAAKASLLTNADLGKAWTAGATGTPGLHLACTGWSPNGKGIVETGAAGSPSFASSNVGPFVSQTTSVYASSKQASTYWARAVQPGLVQCVVQTVKAVEAQGIKVKVLSKGNLPVSKAGSLAAGYRVVANLTSPGKTPRRLYFDVVLVGRGNTLSELSMTSFVAPVPAKVENALAKVVASRIGTPTA